jgi:hypothetical protein
MQTSKIRCLALVVLTVCAGSAFIAGSQAQKKDTAFTPVIPKTWVDAEIAELEIPLADPIGSPKHISADYYYRIPERKIYKSYPVYAPSKEPPGYLDWLKEQEPEIVFDASKLKTEADWVQAGELVFEAPVNFAEVTNSTPVRNPDWYAKTAAPLTKAGVNPFFQYVIRQKGKVEIGTLACAQCHTRVMPDGSVLKGAQGNFPFGRHTAFTRAQANNPTLARLRERQMFSAPWVKPDPQLGLDEMTLDEIIGRHAALIPGVDARQGASTQFPAQIPDLIGVKDRRYLDRTGLQRHRSIVDLMRYGALNQGMDSLGSYNGFIPLGKDFRMLPEPSTQTRYSDEQLYALALYLYSLKPPPNPNKFDALAKHGQKVFEQQGCAKCHTPPLYTNNKLTPVEGFTVSEDHKKKYEILPVPLGTDPNLALKTRRGTGYYKVPSLKGVWYRGPFEHSGSVATLEDWFDANRLKDDYVPTGFKGYGVKTRAVKGHEFGLQLSAEDKQALIAFLKTL